MYTVNIRAVQNNRQIDADCWQPLKLIGEHQRRQSVDRTAKAMGGSVVGLRYGTRFGIETDQSPPFLVLAMAAVKEEGAAGSCDS